MRRWTARRVNKGGCTAENLYVHFPFCRRKCAYCALCSSAGSTPEERAAHVERAVSAVAGSRIAPPSGLKTVYFGGGTPALCDLRPFRGMFPRDAEFTVELHPLDVTGETLGTLKAIGVNRISLGVQSFCDATLASMRRLHTSAEAAAAFRRIREAGFENAGLDLIAGWPGDCSALDSAKRAVDLGAVHVSVYSLIVEPGTALAKGIGLPLQPDDAVLDAIAEIRDYLASVGIMRYEVSNYAKPGFECRHNLAVWRGEDYLGIGPGAYSRVGRERWHTVRCGKCGWRRSGVASPGPVEDARERAIFALRLAEGLDLSRAERLFVPSSAGGDSRRRETAAWKALLDSWEAHLDALVAPGIVRRLSARRYALTDRGFEVCDAVSADLP